MTGFMDSLVARVRPDGSTVRPRPDALLLAHLQRTVRADEEPVVEADEPAPLPVRPRRLRQPPPAPNAAAEHTTASDRAARNPLPPSRRSLDHADFGRPRPPSSSPPAMVRGAESAIAPTPPVPSAPVRPSAGPLHGAQTVRSQPVLEKAGESHSRRPLTSRPTADPATRPPPQRISPSPAPPLSISARTNESRARSEAEQTRSDTGDTLPVEITIDRIDVRLQSSPPAPPSRTGPRAPMSLERYLQSRETSTNRQAP
jgi:hypothetical protein